MAELVTLHDKAEIEAFARRNMLNHLFEIGDLDDFFWPYTSWYGWKAGDEIQQLALVYGGVTPPSLLSYPEAPREGMRYFLRALLPLLPRQLYAHIAPEVVDVLAEVYVVDPRGLHHKMGLANATALDAVDSTGVVAFSEADRTALEAFYRQIPGMMFNERNLATGYYYGVRDGEQVISAAGVHVYAPDYGVAVIANVATLPDQRRQGLSAEVCATLCKALLAQGIEHIGLNVKADNTTAIRLYERLGFIKTGEFGAYMLEAHSA